MALGFVEPRQVESIDDCYFYHTMDLPDHGTIEGHWDLRGRINDYIGRVDVRGARVLDVGTASGFLSFEMEKLGAEVVSFDADCADRISLIPYPGSQYTADHGAWRENTDAFLKRLQNSYWYAHQLYASEAQVYYGDIYTLSKEDLGDFDIAVMGQVLIHLRDPITALCSVAQCCRDTLVLTEGFIKSPAPIARFDADEEQGPEWLWWQCSIGLIRKILSISGFDIVTIHHDRYICNHALMLGKIPLVTVVARRKGHGTHKYNVSPAEFFNSLASPIERLRAAWRVLRRGF